MFFSKLNKDTHAEVTLSLDIDTPGFLKCPTCVKRTKSKGIQMISCTVLSKSKAGKTQIKK